MANSRRKISSSALGVLLVGFLAAGAEAQVTAVPGDINGDDQPNVTDVQATINQALGIATLTPESDVNRDAVTNVVDVQLVIQLALGQLTVTAITPDPPIAGDPMTILGGGFALTPGDNTVTLGGVTLTISTVEVLAGQAVGLTIQLPVSASSGSLEVSTTGQSTTPRSITILPAPPELTVSDASPPESAGTAMVAVSLTRPANAPVSFDFSVTAGTLATTADFTPVSGSLTIASGMSQAVIAVPITDDTINEPVETLAVTVSAVANARVLDSDAVLTILDDDPVQFDLAAQTVTEGAPASQQTVTLTLTANVVSQGNIGLTLSTGSGTATAGLDFQPISARALTLPAGQTSITTALVVLGDELHEIDQTVGFQLSAFNRDDGQGFMAVNDVSAGSIAPVTITDDDPISVSIEDLVVIEYNSSRTETVTLTWSRATEVSCSVALTTADGTALAGQDYTALTGVVSALVTDGQTMTSTVDLVVLGESQVEDAESLTVSLSNAQTAGSGVSVTRDTGNVTIANDDLETIESHFAGDGVGSFDLPRFGLLATEVEVASVFGATAAQGGDIYCVLQNSRTILRIEPSGLAVPVAGGLGDGSTSTPGGMANRYLFASPTAVATDGQTLMVSDPGRQEILEIDLATGILTRFKSQVSARKLAFDSAGDLIALLNATGSSSGAQIVRLALSDGTMTVIAGTGTPGDSGDNGPAVMAQFRARDFVVLANDDIVIADTENDRVRRVDAGSGIITTIAGGGSGGHRSPALTARLSEPTAIALLPSGDLVVPTFSGIRLIDRCGFVTVVSSTGSSEISELVVGPEGQLVAFDLLTHQAKEYIGLGGFTISHAAIAPLPYGLSVSRSIASVHGAAPVQWSVVAGALPPGLTLSGDVSGALLSGSVATEGTFEVTLRATDASGATRERICRLEVGLARAGLDSRTFAPPPNSSYRHVAVNSDGDLRGVARNGGLYRAGATGPEIISYVPVGQKPILNLEHDPLTDTFLATISGLAPVRFYGSGGLGYPVGQALNFIGQQVMGFSGDNGLATLAEFTQIVDVAVAADGRLFVSDIGNHRIRVIDPQGIVKTFAGNGQSLGASGDGGPAILAPIPRPGDLALSDDALFVVEDTRRVRRIDLATGLISTVVGDPIFQLEENGPLTTTRPFEYTAMEATPSGLLLVLDSFLSSPRLRRIDPVAGTIRTVAGGGGVALAQLGSGSARSLDLSGVLSMTLDLTTDSVLLTSVDGVIRLEGLALTPPAVIDVRPPAKLVVGQAADLTIRSSFGQGTGFQWSVTAGALPPGLTLNPGTPDASISGTPTAGGTYAFTLQLTDGAGNTTTADQTISVKALAIRAPASLQLALNGPFGRPLTVEGGTGTGLTWSVTAGNLPQGVALVTGSPAARLEGTPTMAGVSIATITATDDGGFTTDLTMTIDVLPAAVGPSVTALGFQGFGAAFNTGGDPLYASGGYLREFDPLTSQNTIIHGFLEARQGMAFDPFSDDAWAAPDSGLSRANRATIDGEARFFYGPGLMSVFGTLTGLALEPDGATITAQTSSHRLLRVFKDGRVEVLAGTGTAGFTGDGGDATSARLSSPSWPVLRDRTLYFCDRGNDRIRAIDLDSGVITTLAQLTAPKHLAADPAGGLIASSGSGPYTLHTINEATGAVTFLAGGGTDATGLTLPFDQLRFDDIRQLIVRPDRSIVVIEPSVGRVLTR